MIPVSREILADIRTPVEVLRALQNVSTHCFLLESVRIPDSGAAIPSWALIRPWS